MQSLNEKFQKVTLQLKVARETYVAILDLNDYEPCPEARAELQIIIDRYNEIGKEIEKQLA